MRVGEMDLREVKQYWLEGEDAEPRSLDLTRGKGGELAAVFSRGEKHIWTCSITQGPLPPYFCCSHTSVSFSMLIPFPPPLPCSCCSHTLVSFSMLIPCP